MGHPKKSQAPGKLGKRDIRKMRGSYSYPFRVTAFRAPHIHCSYASHTSDHMLPRWVWDVSCLPLCIPSTAILQSEYTSICFTDWCSFMLAKQCCIALSSALSTVCLPPRAPLAPYMAFLSESPSGITHAHPHLLSLPSLVRCHPIHP